MKNTPQYDVGDFFKNKLDSFEAEPPEYIWNNIQSAVTSQAVTTAGTSAAGALKLKLFIAALISVVVIATGIIVYNVYNTDEQKSGNSTINIENKEIPKNEVSPESKTTAVEVKEVEKNKNSEQTKTSVNTKAEKKLNLSKEENNNSASESKTGSMIQETKVDQSRNVVTKEAVTKDVVEPIKVKNKKKIYYLNLTEYKDIESVMFIDAQGAEKLKVSGINKDFEHFPIDISSLPLGKYIIKVKTKTSTFNVKNVTL